ncbi:MAG: hypothetical protein MAG451_02585 [Anaerolineales bacterium]|nr:hypothetical protein [Anaerolineales bacterium]
MVTTVSSTRARFVAGATGGLLGGLVMALFSMSANFLQGPGLWRPVKLIGGLVMDQRAINSAGFDLTPIAGGLVIHFVVSAVLGGLFSLLAARLPDVTVTLYGVVYALIVWFVGLFFVLPVVDPLLVNETNPMLFGVSHIVYGAILGWWISSRALLRT